MLTLTNRQQAIYDFIVMQVQCDGIPPTLMEIAAAFGLTSAAGISDHLKAIERKGYIRRRPGASRGIELLRMRAASRRRSVRVPVLGRVPALFGISGESGHLYFDGRAVSGKAFAVRAEASVARRGILRGDVLIVDTDAPTRRDDLLLGRQGTRTVLLTMAGGGRTARPVLGRLQAGRDIEMLGPVIAVCRTMNGSVG